MNVLWETDGTDRRQWERRREVAGRLAVLEEDEGVLMGRAMDLAAGVRYFNLRNKPEGYWRELFRYQPLAVLSEIGRLDTGRLEADFLEGYRRKKEEGMRVAERIRGWLDDWELRMVYYPHLSLSKDLSSRVRFGVGKEGNAVWRRRTFYGLLETIRGLQVGYGRYLEEIRACGENDSALALLDVFLRNYGEIARRFNRRWDDWPSFYFRSVLHAACRGIVPDRTWLTFEKVPGSGRVTVEAGTAFRAGLNRDGSPVFYRTVERIGVEEMRLERICSFFPERDGERYPAARLGFVTSVWRNGLSAETEGGARLLFGGETKERPLMGLLVESPMWVAGEGKRMLTVAFGLTGEGKEFFCRLLDRLAEGGNRERSRWGAKVLKDAFLLDMTTEEGWGRVESYAATFGEDGFIMLTFCLDRDFPPVVRARREVHGWETSWPVLRISMNPGAWLFPYSWMTGVECERVRLRAEVQGLTALKMYGNIGEMDVSVPFYPFGVQPERGAQLVFGSYEMALKPLLWVKLICKWLQLPGGSEGVYGHYREYGEGVDNRSFRVRTEWLDNRNWKPDSGQGKYLFAPADGSSLPAVGSLPEQSGVCWEPAGGMPVMREEEERYEYGRTDGGFFRMVLDSPGMGFGHAAYHRLFAEVTMENAHRKHPLPLPALPVSPLMESPEVCYEAAEEVCFVAGQCPGETRLFYMEPMGFPASEPVTADRPFRLAKGFGESGGVLFGFTHAEGCDRVRFYAEVVAVEDEERESEEMMPLWYVREGRAWVKLPVEAMVRDTTEGFTVSGLVELLLPCRVTEDWLDEEGILWLWVQLNADVMKKTKVGSFYMNVAEVVLDAETVAERTEWSGLLPAGTIVEAAERIPGVGAIRQVVDSKGGRRKEREEDMRLRMIHRIRHRNRAVTPVDYEDLVLERFPQVAKVKCLPGLDSKGLNRPGLVTVVVIPQTEEVYFPLCTRELLAEIGHFLQSSAGSFARVEAVNPLYEEMTVRCTVGRMKGWSVAEMMLRLREKVDGLIAPWRGGQGLPVFGYGFTLQELKNLILEDKGVGMLYGLSVLQVCREGKRLFRLNEYGRETGDNGRIGASCAWGIPVPAAEHVIRTEQDGAWREEAGIGDVGIGKTWIVG